MVFYELEISFHVFDQRGATFDPITAIHVGDALHLLDFRAVNVAADDSLDAAFARHLHHDFLVFGDVFHRAFGFHFQIGSKGPITESEVAADFVDVQVGVENPVVKARAEAFEQMIEMRQAVELMAVENQIALLLCGNVNRSFHQADAAEVHAGKLLEKFIVISVKQNDARLLPVFPQDFLDENVVLFEPAPVAFQFPAVNEVADDVEVFRFVIAEKIQERFDLGVPRPKVNVRNPNGAIVHIRARTGRVNSGRAARIGNPPLISAHTSPRRLRVFFRQSAAAIRPFRPRSRPSCNFGQ